MQTTPNARVINGDEREYASFVGGALKIEWHIRRSEGHPQWMEFNAADLKVEFNGAPVEMCQRVEIVVDPGKGSFAKLVFRLDDIEIDLDALMALQAFVKPKEVEIPEVDPELGN